MPAIAAGPIVGRRWRCPTTTCRRRAIAQRPVEPRDAARLLDATDPTGRSPTASSGTCPSCSAPATCWSSTPPGCCRPGCAWSRRPAGRPRCCCSSRTSRPGSRTWQALVRPGPAPAAGTVLAATPAGQGAVEVGERLAGGRRRVRLLADPAELLAACGTRGPAALHPRAARRPGALPDGLRRPARLGGRPDRRAAPDHRGAGPLPGAGCGGARRRPGRRPGHLPPDRPAGGSRTTSCTPSATGSRPRPWPPAGRRRGWWRSAPRPSGPWRRRRRPATLEGEADLFIRPGFRFAVVDVLMTNFHLPRSSLLVLLEAFCGPRWRALYDRGPPATGYRFLSFGDAMLVANEDHGEEGDPVSTARLDRRARRRLGPGRGGARRREGRSPPRASCPSAPAARCGSSTPPTSTRSDPRSSWPTPTT